MQKLQAVAKNDGSSSILTDADLDKLQVDVLGDPVPMAPPRAAPFPGQPPSLRPPAPPIRQLPPRCVVANESSAREFLSVANVSLIRSL